jgi:hypothetical protein
LPGTKVPGTYPEVPNPLGKQFLADLASEIEIFANARPRFVKATLPRDHELICPPIQAFWTLR